MAIQINDGNNKIICAVEDFLPAPAGGGISIRSAGALTVTV